MTSPVCLRVPVQARTGWVRPATSQPWRLSKVESCIRGHHVFCTVWSPTVGEWLNCAQETSNTQDPYAVAVMSWSAVTGYVPRKIYAACALFLRKELLTAPHWSWRFTTNLPQGDLKVPCMLTFRGKSKDVARMKKLVVPITCSNPGETQQPRKKVEDHDLSHCKKFNSWNLWVDLTYCKLSQII